MYKDTKIEKLRCPISDKFSVVAITGPPYDWNGRNYFVSLLNKTENHQLKDYPCGVFRDVPWRVKRFCVRERERERRQCCFATSAAHLHSLPLLRGMRPRHSQTSDHLCKKRESERRPQGKIGLSSFAKITALPTVTALEDFSSY